MRSVSRSQPRIRHGRFFWERCDISDPVAVNRVFAGITETFSCVVNNAARGGPVGPSLQIPLWQWRKTFEVNFFSHLDIVGHAIEHCNPGACFIFLSGGGAVTPRPFLGPYATSKLAITKLVEQLSLEYKKFRFYAVAPGTHDTRILRELFRGLQRTPPRFTDFEDVERLLETLVNDRGGRLNGRLLHVRDDVRALLSIEDGGYIRRVEKR